MEKRTHDLYLVARYEDKNNPDEVYFVKKDFSKEPHRLICTCDAFLLDIVEVDRGVDPSRVPHCKHTQHAEEHLSAEHVGVAIEKPAPEEIIHHHDPRVPFWWIERNVKQFIL